VAGSWRDPSGILPGSWPEPSGTVRGRFEVGSRAFWRRKRRQTRPAAPATAQSLARGERDRRGRWPDPSGKLAGTFRHGSGTIRGRFEDGSRWVRGRFGGGSGVSPRRRPRRWRRAGRGASATGGDAGRNPQGRFGDDSRTVRGGFEGVLAAEAAADPAGDPGDPGDGAEPGEGRARPVGTVAGSFGEAGRNLQGRFGDDSRTVRGGFEGVLAAEAASDPAGGPGDPGAPGEPANRRLENRRSVAGARRFRGGRERRGPWPTARAAASRGSGEPVRLNRFRVNPFWGVSLNPTRPRAEPSSVPSVPSSQPPQTARL
jgi:hypothetical protein